MLNKHQRSAIRAMKRRFVPLNTLAEFLTMSGILVIPKRANTIVNTHYTFKNAFFSTSLSSLTFITRMSTIPTTRTTPFIIPNATDLVVHLLARTTICLFHKFNEDLILKWGRIERSEEALQNNASLVTFGRKGRICFGFF
jgi:hypothetical protein